MSLQNCVNEEKIAGIVGWGKTLGVVASIISVDMYDAARIRRTAPKGGDKHTVFRVGEVHGTITKRVEELVEMFKCIDSAKGTTNLWGERWSKLSQNGMRNGVCGADRTDQPAVRPERRGAPLLDPARRRGGARRDRRSATSSRRCMALEPELLATSRRAAAPTPWPSSKSTSSSHAKENPRGDMQCPRWRRTSAKAGAPRSSS